MELMGIGFLAGVVIALIVFMAVLYGRINDVERVCEGKFLLDSSNNNVCSNDTSVSGNNSTRNSRVDKISKEEMIRVLRYYRVGSSSYEKQVLDKIEEMIENDGCKHITEIL